MNHRRVLLLSSLLPWLEYCSGFASPAAFGHSSTKTTTLQASSSSSSSFSDDDFLSELRQRIDQEYASYLPLEGAGAASAAATTFKRPTTPDSKVHVVVFQAGQNAHTIEYPKGSGNNVVLAFESIEACRKFAALLAQQNFVDPKPRQYRLQELQNYFSTVGVFVQVVPEGVELKPPTQNVPKFGHNPNLCQTKKYLDYLFEMTDEDLQDIGLLSAASDETIMAVVYEQGAWQ